MNLQLRWDLYHVGRTEAEQLDRIAPCAASREAVAG